MKCFYRILGSLAVFCTTAVSADSEDPLQQQKALGKAYTVLRKFSEAPEKNAYAIEQVSQMDEVGPGVIRLVHTVFPALSRSQKVDLAGELHSVLLGSQGRVMDSSSRTILLEELELLLRQAYQTKKFFLESSLPSAPGHQKGLKNLSGEQSKQHRIRVDFPFGEKNV